MPGWSGPHTKSVTFRRQPGNVASYTMRSTSYRQWPDRTSRLPYELFVGQNIINDDAAAWSVGGLPSSYPSYNAAHAKAYDRFKDVVKSVSSEMGVTLAQRRQAMGMITSRVFSLLQFARALRKGRFSDAAAALNVSKDPRYYGRTWRRRTRDLGSTFLEWHFGWSPILQDIDAGIKLIGGGYPPLTCRGRGRSTSAGVTVSTDTYGTTYRNISYTSKVQLIATVMVADENELLANQLGLVNPLTVAYELIPWSFLLDHVVNVSQFLGSFNDFVGLSLANSATTHLGTIEQSASFQPFPQWAHNTPSTYKAKKRLDMKRTQGVMPPALQLVLPTRISPWKGATYAALLAQTLKGF